MNNFRFKLGMGREKRKYICPQCQRKKVFVRYMDDETGEHLSDEVGRCDREIKCGYHYKPKQFFEDNRFYNQHNNQARTKPRPRQDFKKPIQNRCSYIDFELFKSSLTGYNNNNFVKFLTQLFNTETINNLIEKYFIGSSKHWKGATTFWQVDTKGKIRTGKVMLYNPENGKRVKEPINHVNWVHSILKKTDFELKQCLFGEHLLIDESKPVAVVESEKTAIIASVYLPQFIWLACGSLTNLNAEKCEILKGRNVILFPDLKAFDKWNEKAKELSNIGRFIVSDLLERKATNEEKEQGLDLADYLIKFDYKTFKLQ